jgi:hypothetical protein
MDTKGNVFGGLTLVDWEYRLGNGKRGNENNWSKADDSQNSLLFTLKNPQNIPARRFVLKTEEKQQAICCDCTWGRRFGDFSVSSNCNASTHGTTFVGKEKVVFTGSWEFQAEEIEVLEIVD